MTAALNTLQSDGMSDELIDDFWFALTALLQAAANLSKILWPSENDSFSQRRGARLRTLLTVEEGPLRSRTIRNHLEHFDARMDEWSKNKNRHVWADGNLCDSRDTQLPMPVEEMFRSYFIRENAIVFRGHEVAIGPIMDAARELKPRITEVKGKLIEGQNAWTFTKQELDQEQIERVRTHVERLRSQE